MKKPLIIANWKMNVSPHEALIFTRKLTSKLVTKKFQATIVLCPDFLSFESTSREIKKRALKKIELGAQNCGWDAKGAYTGEVSPVILAKQGCRWVVLGHSERRYLLNETDDIIRKKITFISEQKVQLTPIICIGERNKGSTEKKKKVFLKKQLFQLFQGLHFVDLPPICIAYEPVWAIGNKQACSPVLCAERIHFFKDTFMSLWGEKSLKNISFLYGGSVSKVNARSFLQDGECDGLLIGGASLDLKEFNAIIESIV